MSRRLALVCELCLSVLLVLALVGGCAPIAPPAKLTFDEDALVVQASVSAVRTAAAQLLDAKVISLSDAGNTLATTDDAAAGVRIARSMEGTDLVGATAKLLAARNTLAALQVYLAHRKAKP